MKTIFVAANIVAIILGVIFTRLPEKKPVLVSKTSVKSPLPQPTPLFKDRWDEVKHLTEKVSQEFDIPPAVTVSIAALESAHGTSYNCREKNNCCGYMAFDGSPGNAKRFITLEDGVQACVGLFAHEKLYTRAYEKRNDPYAMLVEIKAAGYASSANYVNKVSAMKEFNSYENKQL